MKTPNERLTLAEFTSGKSSITLMLLDHFINEYKSIGAIQVYPAKTMIGIARNEKRIAWITQLGNNFVHIVFPFSKPYPENLCFLKIAQVPGQQQFNHHFRMFAADDVNDEVKTYVTLAYNYKQV